MLAAHFSRFLGADPERLHAAAHSHHPWPDVSFHAQQQGWLDAATLHDGKWDHVFGTVLPKARAHIARLLHLPNQATVAVAPNTHELVVRILSCLPRPVRVLTSNAEFHSFDRQIRRLEEDALASVERVAAQPHETFAERFADAAARGGHHLVFFSQVQFDSGFVVDDLAAVVAAVASPETFVVVDGYHAFMALPVDLSGLADRVFYVAGGYKYAMAGEGACFLHCPPGYGPRPRNTGWFAGFADLERRGEPAAVTYARDGSRFLGATFDPTPWYRFNAVQALLRELDVDVAAIHAHVRALQERLLDQLDAVGDLTAGLVPPRSAGDRGNFLCLAATDAGAAAERLAARKVVVDHRGDRLRIGLGVYHDDAAVDELATRLAAALR